MANPNELCKLSGTAQARLIREKKLSPVELTSAVFEQIHQLNPVLNAFCTLVEEQARAEAAEAEAKVMRGEALGRLHGVPVSIKDLICTKDIRTTFGSKAYEDYVPDEDDAVVERLRAAGAIVLGKTNCSEFGYMAAGHNRLFPTTRNPWDLEKTSGGSSAGSAAAVAAGLGSLSVGSDGGGSVRIPGSLCGLVGVKASFGRVPLYPGCRDPRFPGASSWESLEHIGPLTRTVEDAALMLSVMSGPDDRDRHSLPPANFDWLEVLKGDLKGCKVGWSPDWGFATVDPQVRELTAKAVQVFADQLGCEIEEAHPGFPDTGSAFWALVMRDSDLKGMRAMVEKHRAEMLPRLVDTLDYAWTAEEFSNAAMVRQEVNNKMWRYMRKYDFLLTPTLATTAFGLNVPAPTLIDGKQVNGGHWLCFTQPMNMTGQPAATVPAGWTTEGLPVGLQIVGRHLDDPMVLKAAAAYEAANPWKDYWPALV